jgi:hypothetical protein
MVQLNPTRANYLEKFEAFIAAYNSGSRSVEGTYRELLRLSQELSQEEKRHIRENLSEEELAVFDIFLQTAPELSESERSKVKQSAKELGAAGERPAGAQLAAEQYVRASLSMRPGRDRGGQTKLPSMIHEVLRGPR